MTQDSEKFNYEKTIDRVVASFKGNPEFLNAGSELQDHFNNRFNAIMEVGADANKRKLSKVYRLCASILDQIGTV